MATAFDKRKLPIILWVDVPQEKHVDREFLEGCAGASLENGEQWIQRKLAILAAPQCAAAVQWSTGSDKWTPCAHPVWPGQKFCTLHGGKRERVLLSEQEKLERRLLRRLETARGKRRKADQEIAIVLDEFFNHGVNVPPDGAGEP